MHPLKKTLFLSILLLGLSGKSLYGQFEVDGQYGAQFSVIMPTGYYSYILKPAPAYEVFLKLGDMDDFYSLGLSFGYASFKPTQDTFQTYAINSGTSNQLLPGYEVIHSYEELLLGFTTDFRILPKKKFSPILGLDVHFDVISISEDDYAETVIQSSSSGDDYWQLSILPHIGLQYKISDKFFLAASLAKNIGITGEIPTQNYWKPSFTFTYNPGG